MIKESKFNEIVWEIDSHYFTADDLEDVPLVWDVIEEALGKFDLKYEDLCEEDKNEINMVAHEKYNADLKRLGV